MMQTTRQIAQCLLQCPQTTCTELCSFGRTGIRFRAELYGYNFDASDRIPVFEVTSIWKGILLPGISSTRFGSVFVRMVS